MLPDPLWWKVDITIQIVFAANGIASKYIKCRKPIWQRTFQKAHQKSLEKQEEEWNPTTKKKFYKRNSPIRQCRALRKSAVTTVEYGHIKKCKWGLFSVVLRTVGMIATRKENLRQVEINPGDPVSNLQEFQKDRSKKESRQVSNYYWHQRTFLNTKILHFPRWCCTPHNLLGWTNKDLIWN